MQLARHTIGEVEKKLPHAWSCLLQARHVLSLGAPSPYPKLLGPCCRNNAGRLRQFANLDTQNPTQGPASGLYSDNVQPRRAQPRPRNGMLNVGAVVPPRGKAASRDSGKLPILPFSRSVGSLLQHQHKCLEKTINLCL